MRVLLDNNVDQRFVRLLPGHEIVHARTMRWAELENGDSISVAEVEGFDVLVTGDKNLRYPQNLARRRIAIVVLDALFIKWAHIAPLAPQVFAILDAGPQRGTFFVVDPERKA